MSPAEVRRLTPEDWELFREIRLAALQGDPAAFGSSYEREVAYDEARWRERSAGVVVGLVDGSPVAVGDAFEVRDGWQCVVAMWTRPSYRGRGIGGLVLEEIVRGIESAGDRAELFVMLANPAVRRLYERHGFTGTGEVETHGGRPAERLVR